MRRRAPRLTLTHASTTFLRVPHHDWPRVKIGEKTEFRTRHRERLAIISVKPPTPVVAYTENTLGEFEFKVMVLEGYKYEPLFNISMDPEAVAREGFPSYDEFRRYWRARTGGTYMPVEKVWVWRLRPVGEDDLAMLGRTLVDYLYGRYME